MSEAERLSKQELLELLEKLEKNPNKWWDVLAGTGIFTLGGIGGGAAAAVFGATTTSIPIVTALTGMTLVAAAPVAVVAGGAVAGGAAFLGIASLMKNIGFHQGKQEQIKRNAQEEKEECDRQEREANFKKANQRGFYYLLRDKLQHDLLEASDAQNLLQHVVNGRIALNEAQSLLIALA